MQDSDRRLELDRLQRYITGSKKGKRKSLELGSPASTHAAGRSARADGDRLPLAPVTDDCCSRADVYVACSSQRCFQ